MVTSYDSKLSEWYFSGGTDSILLESDISVKFKVLVERTKTEFIFLLIFFYSMFFIYFFCMEKEFVFYDRQNEYIGLSILGRV